jgi:hypothetical protein
MTLTDFVWIAVGETLLAATFGLGILVGCSLKKRISHDDYDTGKAQAGKGSYWHNADHPNFASRPGGGAAGGADARHEANHAKRPPR